jgi:hypothetical protein
MAEEINNSQEQLLARMPIQEAVKKELKTKTVVYHPKDMVEALLTECITQLTSNMNSLFLIFHDKETQKLESFNTATKRLDAIKGTYNLFRLELATVIECLEPYHRASLNPRHLAVKDIIHEGVRRLKEYEVKLKKAKYINNNSVTQFAKDICLLITNMHVCLHNKTPKKETQRIVKEYCHGKGV